MADDLSENESFIVQPFPNGHPAADWFPEQLGAYAHAQAQAISDSEQALAVKYFRLGLALNFLRRTFGHGQWKGVLRELDVDKTKASRARAIAKTFQSEDDLAGLTLKQAYEKRSRKSKTATTGECEKTDKNKLRRFLEKLVDSAESLLDAAAFAEPAEAVDLAGVADKAVLGLEKIRDWLRRQAGEG